MRGIRGFLAGFLGLIALGSVLRAEQGGRYKPSGILAQLRAGLDRALDPNVPAIPDLRSPARGGAPSPRPGQAGGGGGGARVL